tara:strand:+ start:19 stop:1425 length:1407 start_codon:yes stop_codon:yes gene_type:complete
MTSLSWQDVASMGPTIGFYPDDPLSFIITPTLRTGNPVQGGNGIGICNNLPTFRQQCDSVNNSFHSASGNEGFFNRQEYISYDPAVEPRVDESAGSTTASPYSVLMTKEQSASLWKSYISSKVDATASKGGCVQISVMATIYLRHIHSFFNQIPLLKGAFMKMTLNLNNTSFTQVIADSAGLASGANRSLVSTINVTNAVGGVCPLMWAGMGYDINSEQMKTATSGTPKGTYYGNVSVGSKCLDTTINNALGTVEGALANSVYLYVPSYTFNPVFEASYLSNPVKEIAYTDIYQYEIQKVASGGTINSLITNGLANMKSVCVMPFIATTSAYSAGIPAYQSPYDPAGCGATSPLAHLTNFNVVVSGQNMIYNTQRYGFEEFNNQFYGVNAVNGGLTDGLASGLIDRLGWDMEQCFYYVDLSRMLPAEKSVPKSLQLIGTSVCSQPLDLMVFVEYGLSVQIDSLTGIRM